jgi:phosphoenolpyruvate synthase/pyruvate phosphate dikinase
MLGRKVVLARAETSPEDIIGMVNAEAIITARGGMTSHAAVVARSMGKCCAAGCTGAIIDEEKKTMTSMARSTPRKISSPSMAIPAVSTKALSRPRKLILAATSAV